ncbi:FG-GAP-like repeat-containing protein [Nocardioides gilvus]|uniref:FG-GAP-like repeat-containing protein n=1 Tax=Nocardioides gilvus TaxID=1735589 RepID=UPI000D74E4C9|nr:FG-GAP-like repeat-containing protein [Nocardioides gilvus]
MRTNQIRFITACQQLLALGVVLAVLAPATNIISLDVVSRAPVTGLAAEPAPALAQVPTAPVEPEVEEYAIVEDDSAEAGVQREDEAPAHEDEGHAHEDEAGAHEGHEHGLAADVAPEDVVEATVSAPIEGFGAVGVTWDTESRVAAGELALQVRTREGAEWGDWTEMVFDDAHAPDPDSPDARTARNGTDALIVGEVDEVEVRADGAGELPQGLSLAVIDPGAAEETREEGPAIETAPAAPADSTDSGDDDKIALQSGRTAAKPTIYSRAQWGADEKIRHKSSLSYGSIEAGFVHHTVNANNYTAEQVPGIIRSIYTYHVKSRGWSDVGYNFLVDRFGRVWEGRYGGVDKAVIGAHTSGYNHLAFAMSAIGNFETTGAPAAMVNAYGALFAWKLGLHGIDPRSMKERVGSRTMPAVNGHRDAGSTACPGKYLYAQLGAIRAKAAAAQTGVAAPTPTAPTPTKPTPAPAPTPAPPTLSAPNLSTNLAGTPHPDLVARRSSDSQLVILPTGGMSALAAPKKISTGWKYKTRMVSSADLTGDGMADLVSVSGDGTARVHRGLNNGKFKKKATTVITLTRGHDLLTAVGDINGDKRADLVARHTRTGKAYGFLQTASGKFTKVRVNRNLRTYTELVAVGDITGDGRPDLMARHKKGAVHTISGLGSSKFAKPKATPGNWSPYKTIAGGGDFDGDGRTDLLVRRGTGTLYVLPGTGRGSFGARRGPLATEKSLDHLSVNVVTSSGSPDLMARRGRELVHLANPGTYELRAPIETGIDASSAIHLMNAGDWNGDGKGDVITVGVTGALQLRLGDGTGKLSSPRILIGTGFHGVQALEAVGDVNGDGKPDLIGTVNGVTRFFAGNGKKRVKGGVAVPGYKGRLARVPGGASLDPNVYDVRLPVSQVKLQAGTTDVVARGKKSGRLFLFTATTKGLTQRRYLAGGMRQYNMFS